MAKARKAAKAKATAGGTTAAIRVRLFDGTRAPLDSKRTYLLRLLDGEQRQILVKEYRGADRTLVVPFHDNFADAYTILASADNCADAGFYPVMVTPSRTTITDLMLIPKPPRFDFQSANWDLIQQRWPAAFAALAFGVSPAAARQRYDALLSTPFQATMEGTGESCSRTRIGVADANVWVRAA